MKRALHRLLLPLVLGAVHCTTHPPSVVVLEATELGTLQQSPLVVGRDGAQSARVFGQEVWTFGDTFLAEDDAEGENFVSNTFASSDGGPTAGLPLVDRLDDAGAPAQLLVPTSDEWAFDLAHRAHADGGCDALPCGGRFATWPAATVFDPDGGTALVFYDLVSAAPGDFNFQGLGQGLAAWSDLASLPTRPEPGVCAGSPTLLFCQDEPGFGATAVVVGADVLAFGCVQDGLSFSCELGKVPFAQALVKSSWTYWTGKTWSQVLSQAQPVFEGAPTLGVFFDAYAKAWIALYARPLSSQIVLRTAPAPTGPWSDETELFVADLKGGSGGVDDALPHPELSPDDGKTIYATYSRSTANPYDSEFVLERIVLK